MCRLTSLCLYLPVFNLEWNDENPLHDMSPPLHQHRCQKYDIPAPVWQSSQLSIVFPLRFVIMVRKWFKFVLTFQPPVLWYCWGGWRDSPERNTSITHCPAGKYSLSVFQRHLRYSLTLIDVLKMSCSRTPSRAHGCLVSRLLLHLK